MRPIFGGHALLAILVVSPADALAADDFASDVFHDQFTAESTGNPTSRYHIPVYANIWSELGCRRLIKLTRLVESPQRPNDGTILQCEGDPLSYQLRFRAEVKSRKLIVTPLGHHGESRAELAVDMDLIRGMTTAQRFAEIPSLLDRGAIAISRELGLLPSKEGAEPDSSGALHTLDPKGRESSEGYEPSGMREVRRDAKGFLLYEPTDRDLVEVAFSIASFFRIETNPGSVNTHVERVGLTEKQGIYLTRDTSSNGSGVYGGVRFWRPDGMESARVSGPEGTDKPAGGSDCNPDSQDYLEQTQDKLPNNGGLGDACGHMLGKQFGGSGRVYSLSAGVFPPSKINIFAQDARMNNTGFKTDENKAVKYIGYPISYTSSSVRRPCGFKLEMGFGYDNINKKRPDAYFAKWKFDDTGQSASESNCCRLSFQGTFMTTGTSWTNFYPN